MAALMIFVIFFLLAILISWRISLVVYKRLKKGEDPQARTFQVLTFIATIAAITFSIWVILSNIKFER